METNSKIYLVVWNSKVDGELDTITKAFSTLENARKYFWETLVPCIKREWDLSDAQSYDMNDEYEEGAVVVDESTDNFYIYSNGNAAIDSDEAGIRELVVE